MAFRDLIIPLKYKFLSVLLLITLSAIGVFFYLTNQIFSEDKRLFVMDLNLTLLRAATSELKLEMRSRLDELQILIPRIYRGDPNDQTTSAFEGLSDHLPDELLRIRFYRRTSPTSFDLIRDYKNTTLLEKKQLVASDLDQIDKKHPLPLEAFADKPELKLLNRSIHVDRNGFSSDLAVLNFMLPGNFIEGDSKEVIISVDLMQNFLRAKLNQSDVAQLFLITEEGTLLSHSLLQPTIMYSNTVFPHPIVERLKKHHFPRESFELEIDHEAYLCNLSETGFKGIYVVSQIKKSDAYLALNLLMEKSILIAALIICIAIIASILFAARLGKNIEKLKHAAETIGAGNLKGDLVIHSNDELQAVAQSFRWMAKRLRELVAESAQKARMEDELETARLVQSTLLATPELNTDAVQCACYYQPATECGGDIWDTRLDGNILTVIIGDATGHGAPAAIVTAVIKSCFDTLNAIYSGTPLSPVQLLTTLNSILSAACKGKLLMTMCIIQLDLETGELTVGSAGHEAPLVVRGSHLISQTEKADKPAKQTAEVLFARGERLGFDPNSEYESVNYQMSSGDTLLLYTDGVTEARNQDSKEWGERSLKKALVKAVLSAPNDVKQQLVTALNAHIQGVVPEDDITFVLITLKKTMSSIATLKRPKEEKGSNAA